MNIATQIGSRPSCPSNSSTAFTKFGCGGPVREVQPIRAVTTIFAPYMMQFAFVPENHQHPHVYTSVPVNQNHPESRGNDGYFQMRRSQTQNHPHLHYGQFHVKVRNPKAAPTVEPVPLKMNNGPLVTVNTEYGREITAAAKEGRGNPEGLAETASLKLKNLFDITLLKREHENCENQGQVTTESASLKLKNMFNITSLKTEGEKHENHWQVTPESASLKLKNLFNITSLKAEFEKDENQWKGSPDSASLKLKSLFNITSLMEEFEKYEDQWKGTLESASLMLKNLFNVTLLKVEFEKYESQWQVTPESVILKLRNLFNIPLLEAEFEKYENQWRVTPESASLKLKNLFNITSLKTEFEKYENQWQVTAESASLKLKNLFNITSVETEFEIYENQWQVTPEAKRQKGIKPGLKISHINAEVHIACQLGSALDRSLSDFKDLTVPGTDSIPHTPGNLTAKTTTYSKKRKRVSKWTFSFRATEENASSNGDDREQVRKVLRTYDALRRNLMNEDESCKEAGGGTKRAHLRAGTMMIDGGQCINRSKRYIGSVPGVHVGDHFYFRTELCVIGLHGPIQSGIDYITARNTQWNEPVAISVISSGGYEDDEDEGEVLVYTGQGGNNYIADKKQSVDQKLERGNLALERSMHYGVEIRVVRGIKDSGSPSGKIYVYDGLYKIEHFWLDKGCSGCGVFKYRLQRLPGQPELGSIILKNTKVWKSQPQSRTGLLHSDISLGSEKLPVRLANTVDNEKGPPHFEYTSRCIKHPNCSVQLDSSEGCACIGGCDSSIGCLCVQRYDKQIPYNSKGILVKGKPLIYECNEQCRCPPSCRNRVTQRGLNAHLEVFRTSDKRWGVRSWDTITAGTFICEYTGQVVSFEEQATHCFSDNDYILNLRHVQERWTEWGSVSDILSEQKQQQHASCQAFPQLNFVIDASKSGNASRFLKHSTSPNVFMQFVLYDHHDSGFPHVTLFARENIPPLTELTFDYGYVARERVK